MHDRDVILMLNFREGDLSAFDELVRRHKGPLMNYLYRFLGDRTWAEDSAQEVFCRLFRAAGRYEARGKFTTYLYTIATRHAANQLKKKRRLDAAMSLDRSWEDGEGGIRSLHQQIANGNPGPRDRAERSELSETIREALLSLPVPLRTVFILCEEEGMRYEEVAAVLRVPIGTVRSRMHRAVRRLREQLKAVKGEWYTCSAEE